MAGPQTARVIFLRNFRRYQKEIKHLLTRQRSEITLAQNSAKLNGLTVNEILAPARADLTTHANNKNNPHQETITSIGSYSSTYVQGQLDNKVPLGVIPVSTYGIGDNMDDAAVNAAWTYSGWVVSIAQAMNVIISGTPYVVPAFSLDLRTIDAAPANKSFHVYLYLKFGEVSYRCSTDTPPEGVAIMYLGTFTTNASGVASKSFKTVIRIDTFRISTIARGSVIPVSSGDYAQIVPFGNEWKPL